ncbi:MAG: alpha/beta hydrolase [Actinomycetota bacterium]
MEPLRFETSDGLSLEGELRRPTTAAVASAIICHPHPLQGGSKDHPILWAIRNELAHRGFVVLAFNYRGVMGSHGEYGGGAGETLDARAALDRVRVEVDGPSFVTGVSFGADIALRLALEDDRVAALALVGFVEEYAERPEFPAEERLASLERRVLFLSGERDRFSTPEGIRALSARLPDAETAIVEGADHLFFRREREAAAVVGGFAERAIRGGAAGG